MRIRRILKWTIKIVAGILIAFLIAGFVAYWGSTNECDQNATAPARPMKAIRFCEYGVVTVDSVEKPVPKDNQVLIRVRTASLNFIDVSLIQGPWIGRLFFGLRKPSDPRVGRDVAGEVEAVGKDVTQFKPGDEVFGLARGLAGRICLRGRASVGHQASERRL